MGIWDMILVFVVTGILVSVSWHLYTLRHLPPGPWGWPVLGYLPNVVLSCYTSGLPPHEVLAKLSHKYGSVFSMYVGRTLVVVIDKYDVIKEAFNNPLLNAKPDVPLFKDVGMGEGLSLSSGDAWKQQRRFTHSTLRSFGVGAKGFEENISNEVKYLSEQLTLLQGKSVHPKRLINNATSNVICQVAFGKRFEYNDPSFGSLLDSLAAVAELGGAGGLQIFFPIAKYFQQSVYGQLVQCFKNMKEFIEKEISDHQQELDLDNPRDYIDVYLNEIQMAEKLNSKSFINRDSLTATVIDLFGAGTETAATTLLWGILFILAYPEVQEQIQQELDSLVGRNRKPCLADKPELPFTYATLLEIQRIGSVAPLGQIHYSDDDTNLAGYKIPKGSIIVPNLWSVHNDPKIWNNPKEFHPERFLDKDGVVKERDELIPFSIGRRVCIGEHLAKMELFIFFTHLLHQFTFTKPDDSPPLSFEEVTGVTRSPKPFLVQITPRE